MVGHKFKDNDIKALKLSKKFKMLKYNYLSNNDALELIIVHSDDVLKPASETLPATLKQIMSKTIHVMMNTKTRRIPPAMIM